MRQNSFVLQAFRGLAAVLVVLYHVSHSIFDTEKYWPQRPFGDVFRFSHAGVEFFFVLSGFIIFAVHRRDIGQADRLRDFAWKRIRRIYPAYWVVLIAVIPMFYFIKGMGTGIERVPAIWLDSALLVHVLRSGGQVLSVSWTLFHEVLFYAVFSLLILSRRVGSAVFLAWMMGSVVTYIHGPGWPEIMSFYFSPMHLLFAMGMLAAWAAGSTRHLTAPFGLALLGSAVFAATAIVEDCGVPSSATTSLGYGLGSALLIIGAVELERAGRLRVAAPLILLGDASYSVYLMHILALSFCTKLIRPIMTHWSLPLTGVFVLLAVLGVAAGLAYHRLVEAPLLNLLGRRRPRHSGPAIVGASGQA